LVNLGMMDRFKTEREKAFMGMVAEWQWKEVAVGVTGDIKSHWLPMKILDQRETEELMKSLEAKESGDVLETSNASGTTADVGTDASTDEGSKLD